MEQLGQLMRVRREQYGFTQLDIAKKLSVSTRQLMRWESGEAIPTISNLAQWLRVLGVQYREVEPILLNNNELMGHVPA